MADHLVIDPPYAGAGHPGRRARGPEAAVGRVRAGADRAGRPQPATTGWQRRPPHPRRRPRQRPFGGELSATGEQLDDRRRGQIAEIATTWWLAEFEPETVSVDRVRGVLRDGPAVP